MRSCRRHLQLCPPAQDYEMVGEVTMRPPVEGWRVTAASSWKVLGYRSGVELHGDLVARRDQAPLRRFRGLGVSMLL